MKWTDQEIEERQKKHVAAGYTQKEAWERTARDIRDGYESSTPFRFREPVAVKIVKANRPTYWYADKIGAIFHADGISGDAFFCVLEDGNWNWIDLDDAIVLRSGFDRYQRQTRRTWRGDGSVQDQIDNAVLGLVGEGGEIAEKWKKHRFQGHEWNCDNVAEEIGDILFYAARLAELIGWDLSTVADANIEKLRRRYPEGFSEERSRNREE